MLNVLSAETISYENKAAVFFLLDFTIGSGGSLEGNDSVSGIDGILEMLKCIQNSTDKKETELFEKIITDMRSTLNSTINPETMAMIRGNREYEYKFYCSGWTGHYISVGFCKNINDKSYDLVIVNAGTGAELFPCRFPNMDVIVKYKNISGDQLKNLGKFLTHCKALKTRAIRSDEIYFYYGIEFICKGCEKGYITGPPQVSGTCSFTNMWNIKHFLDIHEGDLSLSFNNYEKDKHYKDIVARGFYNDIISRIDINSIEMLSASTNEIVQSLKKLYNINTTEYDRIYTKKSRFDSMVPLLKCRNNYIKFTNNEEALREEKKSRLIDIVEKYGEHIKDYMNGTVDTLLDNNQGEINAVAGAFDYYDNNHVSNRLFLKMKSLYVIVANTLLNAYKSGDDVIIDKTKKMLTSNSIYSIIATFPLSAGCGLSLFLFARLLLFSKFFMDKNVTMGLNNEASNATNDFQNCNSSFAIDPVDIKLLQCISHLLKNENVIYYGIRSELKSEAEKYNIYWRYIPGTSVDLIGNNIRFKSDFIYNMFLNESLLYDMEDKMNPLYRGSPCWFMDTNNLSKKKLDTLMNKKRSPNPWAIIAQLKMGPIHYGFISETNMIYQKIIYDAVALLDGGNINVTYSSALRLIIVYLAYIYDVSDKKIEAIKKDISQSLTYIKSIAKNDGGSLKIFINLLLAIFDISIPDTFKKINYHDTVQSVSTAPSFQIGTKTNTREHFYEGKKIGCFQYSTSFEYKSEFSAISYVPYKAWSEDIGDFIYVNEFSELQKCLDLSTLVPLYKLGNFDIGNKKTIPVQMELRLFDPSVNENMAYLLRTLIMFQSSALISVNKIPDRENYYVFLLCYNSGFIVNDDEILFEHDNIIYTVDYKDDYNQGMPNCINVRKGSDRYMVCFELRWQRKMNEGKFIEKKIFIDKPQVSCQLLNRKVHIIKRRNKETKYCDMVLSDANQAAAYILSTFYWGNMYLLRNHFAIVYDIVSHRMDFYDSIFLRHILDGTPYSLLFYSILQDKAISTHYKSLTNNIEIRDTKGICLLATFDVKIDPYAAMELPGNDVKYECQSNNLMLIKRYTGELNGRNITSVVYHRLCEYKKKMATKSGEIEIYNIPLDPLDVPACKINGMLEGVTISDPQKYLLSYFMTRQGDARKHNLDISIDFYRYLIDPAKTQLCPVRELIMGGGKSQFIMPMTILLLAGHPDEKIRKRSILVCVPESLLDQTYEVLSDTVSEIASKPVYTITYTDKFYIGSKSTGGEKKFGKLISSRELLGILAPKEKPHNNAIFVLSDTVFKMLHLISHSSIVGHIGCRDFLKESFIIFDEIDFIANPLTCELNVQVDDINEMPDYSVLIDLSEIYFELLSSESGLWELNDIIYEDTKFHRILLNYEKSKNTIFKFLSFELQRKFEQYDKYNILITYLEQTVIEYILTHKFTYDYGIPASYPTSISTGSYMFKAIPYIALDTPAYGSEFSDPILTTVLTVFSYKMIGICRDIDKEIICNYLKNSGSDSLVRSVFPEEIYIITGTKYYDIELAISTNDHKAIPDFKLSGKTYANVKYYTKNIIHNYLNRYVKQMINISMTELLMSVNYTDFISFTGTPFVFLPIAASGTIGFNTEVVYSNVEVVIDGKKDLELIDTSVAICMAINKMEKMYLFSNRFESIYELLASGKYNTFIDVGAFFVGTGIVELVKMLALHIHSKFRYIVYVTNTKKYHDRITNKSSPVLSLSENNKEAIFLFDNSHITGIDFEKYMPIESVGLTTISNDTRLRDISQGIFRLRKIFKNKEQYTDFIIDKKLADVVINSKCEIPRFKDTQCTKNMAEKIHGSVLEKGEDSSLPWTLTDINESVRWNLYNLLCQNEHKYGKSQLKMMYKQNMFGVYRKGTTRSDFYDIVNFVYPTDKIINAEDHNIDEHIVRYMVSPEKCGPDGAILDDLLNKYRELSCSKYNTSVSLSINKEVTKEQKKDENTKLQFSRSVSNTVDVYYDNFVTSDAILKKMSNTTYRAQNFFGLYYGADNTKNWDVDAIKDRLLYVMNDKGNFSIIIVNGYDGMRLHHSLIIKYNEGALLTLDGVLIATNNFDITKYKNDIEKDIRNNFNSIFRIRDPLHM